MTSEFISKSVLLDKIRTSIIADQASHDRLHQLPTIQIEEIRGTADTPNWCLIDLDRWPAELREVARVVVAGLQQQYRLELPPLGASASPEF